MPRTKPHAHYHKDGSLWAQGQTLDGEMHGAWKFFRKDGTLLRSGSFDRGAQVGEWTTHDKAGKPYKTTLIKPSASNAAVRAAAKNPAKKAAGVAQPPVRRKAAR